ncbi:uncharacterized protein LOC116844730 [Odontomachus brunneus]|uniref:uncharacterized protein LOC116844730 n=1 Tax=Odontomachus brunneus TaxID=486640 RepID=UPI0013F21867|nr:uncharacterized protein LOC116844730 [Odontomachus brunneus]
MSRLFLFLLLIYIVSTTESCIIQEKKEKPDIRVIELDDSSSESSEQEIVALHLPDRRRREIDSRARNSSCKTDEDCGPGAICLAYLTCVKGKWRTIDFPETTRAAN